ncbi:hypothetical protein NEOKW01_1221 [Nematocida sp. AWRm80]|nr:hypothetical protein NEOKW01_1221 [Nematocida sp. AWRm80]
MKALGIILLAIGTASCYLDSELQENRRTSAAPLKTFFFLRRFSPAYINLLEKPLPMGAHKRLESEERYSPFHSVLLVRKAKRPDDYIESMIKQTDSTESFIKDFLVSHLKHTQALEAPKQFDTEKIYNDLYRKNKHHPSEKHKSAMPDIHLLGDEIDNIMANAAKELMSSTEEEKTSTGLGKSFDRTKKKVKKNFKKAKKAIKHGFKFNGLTVILVIVATLVSGYAGYTFKGRSSTESYAPLSK